MKRTALAAAVTAALLLLAGCSGGGDQISVAVNGSSPAASDAPLTAETPAASEDGGEAAFLDEVRAKLRPDNVIPEATDAQLIAAGEKACEGIASGADTLTLSLIEGEPTNGMGYYTDSGVIITAARGTICD